MLNEPPYLFPIGSKIKAVQISNVISFRFVSFCFVLCFFFHLFPPFKTTIHFKLKKSLRFFSHFVLFCFAISPNTRDKRKLKNKVWIRSKMKVKDTHHNQNKQNQPPPNKQHKQTTQTQTNKQTNKQQTTQTNNTNTNNKQTQTTTISFITHHHSPSIIMDTKTTWNFAEDANHQPLLQLPSQQLAVPIDPGSIVCWKREVCGGHGGGVDTTVFIFNHHHRLHHDCTVLPPPLIQLWLGVGIDRLLTNQRWFIFFGFVFFFFFCSHDCAGQFCYCEM